MQQKPVDNLPLLMKLSPNIARGCQQNAYTYFNVVNLQ